jgi:hypothetical protein
MTLKPGTADAGGTVVRISAEADIVLSATTFRLYRHYPEEGSSTFPRNVFKFLPDYTALHHTRQILRTERCDILKFKVYLATRQ